jgi:pyridoxal phosphate phosphatase PHOSPHO2
LLLLTYILLSSDIAYVRRYRGLESRIKAEGAPSRVKVVIKPWAGAWEIEEHFQELVADRQFEEVPN